MVFSPSFIASSSELLSVLYFLLQYRNKDEHKMKDNVFFAKNKLKANTVFLRYCRRTPRHIQNTVSNHLFYLSTEILLEWST
ncbi:hypothetical protein H206_00421 [Candidatus Electrothrix aarhusensis]|uniref:Uncharacterized protein n=1 Tax=Candidatus Electrothrix aarhusensis TaxID=1859131 RepID=A0A3S3R7I2_9BACT|nr:hypothetical protein H206_00421 [Candidatus Electrothrix aarhusensis]